MLSPILAYVFITYAKEGWRVCYWWAFAFESLAVIALFFFYKPPSFETKHRVDRKTKRQLLGELDYLGLLLFAAGCILLLLGVNWVRISRRLKNIYKGRHSLQTGRKGVTLEERRCHYSHCSLRRGFCCISNLGSQNYSAISYIASEIIH